jgi:hypothetical protein
LKSIKGLKFKGEIKYMIKMYKVGNKNKVEQEFRWWREEIFWGKVQNLS